MIAFQLLVFSLTGASAFGLSRRQDSDANEDSPDACMPTNSTGFPDLNAPCNAFSRIQQLCVYGEQIRSILDGAGLNDYAQIDNEDMKEHSPGYQRDCICQSQQFDQMRGCIACYNARNGDSQALFEPSAIESFSSSYCAVTAMPTVGYPTAILAITSETEETGSANFSPLSSSTSGSIGTQTDVSLYYTPAASGAQAWDVVLPTGASATFSNLKTSAGQIVATAAVEKHTSTADAISTADDIRETSTKGDASEQTSTASKGGAMALGAIDCNMAIGAIGLAAIVAGL